MYPSAAMVEVERPIEDPSIQLYQVRLRNGAADQACTLLACLPPLKCQINNLTLAEGYTVEVKACVPGDNVCSTTTEQTFLIKPKGKASNECRGVHSQLLTYYVLCY